MHNSLEIAKLLCQLSDWKITNLKLQKIMYFCQMVYLKEKNTPLIDSNFKAWDYGPVNVDVYNRAKSFGRNPIMNVFHDIDNIEENSDEHKIIKKCFNSFNKYSSSKLVSVTHRQGSPWDKVYKQGNKNIEICNEDIKNEYDKIIK